MRFLLTKKIIVLLLLLLLLLPLLSRFPELGFLVDNSVGLHPRIDARLRTGLSPWVYPVNVLMPCDGKTWLFATTITLIIPLPNCGTVALLRENSIERRKN